jgi:hypothetical protein
MKESGDCRIIKTLVYIQRPSPELEAKISLLLTTNLIQFQNDASNEAHPINVTIVPTSPFHNPIADPGPWVPDRRTGYILVIGCRACHARSPKHIMIQLIWLA